MSPRPPFDPFRAAFWLVACVVALHGVVILVGIAACAIYAGDMLASSGNFRCDVRDKLSDLLAAALAAALAFAGGAWRRPPD